MNNNYEKALKKIKHDQRCKPTCCCSGIVGPTGPTARLVNSSNK